MAIDYNALAFPKSRTGLSHSQEQIAADGLLARHWERVKRVVEERDGRRCRVCGRFCAFGAKLLKDKADPHHIVFQSAGGADETWNVLKLCRSCHDDVHVHRKLALSGNADQRDEMGRGMVKLERLVEGGYEVVRFV